MPGRESGVRSFSSLWCLSAVVETAGKGDLWFFFSARGEKGFSRLCVCWKERFSSARETSRFVVLLLGKLGFLFFFLSILRF